MAEKKALDDVLNGISLFNTAEALYAPHQKTLDQIEAIEEQEKAMGDAGAINPGTAKAAKKSDKYLEAKAAKALYDDQKKDTLTSIRGGLAELVSGADSDKLIKTVALSFNHESKKYKELAKKFQRYALYEQYFHPLDKEHGGSAEREQSIAREAVSDLSEAIARRILKEGKIKDPKKAKLWGDYLRFVVPNNPDLAKELIKEDYESLKTELKNANLADYLGECVEKDDECLNFARAYHRITNEKKKKAA